MSTIIGSRSAAGGSWDRLLRASERSEAALEKGSKWVYFVSQTVAGATGSVCYVTTFSTAPKLSELIGGEAFAEITSETMLMRMVPELSNVPEDVAKIAPDFWRSKRMAAVHVMPKPPETAKPG